MSVKSTVYIQKEENWYVATSIETGVASHRGKQLMRRLQTYLRRSPCFMKIIHQISIHLLFLSQPWRWLCNKKNQKSCKSFRSESFCSSFILRI